MSPQQTIAHYRITAKLGEGGMGEVYRATDTKLGRDVAVKILSASFARDPARMARFEREAKVPASLNHPHIAQIYGVEEGTLVMEFGRRRAAQGGHAEMSEFFAHRINKQSINQAFTNSAFVVLGFSIPPPVMIEAPVPHRSPASEAKAAIRELSQLA